MTARRRRAEVNGSADIVTATSIITANSHPFELALAATNACPRSRLVRIAAASIWSDSVSIEMKKTRTPMTVMRPCQLGSRLQVRR